MASAHWMRKLFAAWKNVTRQPISLQLLTSSLVTVLHFVARQAFPRPVCRSHKAYFIIDISVVSGVVVRIDQSNILLTFLIGQFLQLQLHLRLL